MPENTTPTNFLEQVNALIEQHLANEQFGVSELADALSMSRSNLLRKVKKDTKLSVSQLINQARLKRAMEMLRKSSLNVSEVSHQVGFNSTSYFIKCFREYYGYPPGEVGKRPEAEIAPIRNSGVRRKVLITVAVGLIVLIVVALYVDRARLFGRGATLEKSIAILPFKNESNDSTNVYLINGLMESTLGNLQKIKALRVISRTSSEKYRNTTKSIPEMAKELDVNYFVEGSGQKIGNQIVLNIQLIEALTDRHLWSNQYKREAKDIFQLQQEVSKNIADAIEAIITPEEEKRIQKKPTENLEAYDLFLKAKDFQALGGGKNERQAITYFKKAIEQDPEFALAYGEIAIQYYYFDLFKADKNYPDSVNHYADKAFLYDSKLEESFMAKAVAYMSKKEYESAVSYLEKALEYNPNSARVIATLSDFYTTYVPNTGKYLQYALKGVQLDAASMDSSTASYAYLRLGNALIQTGFVDESLKYVDKSLEYNPKNPFSRYIRAFIMFAKTKDIKLTRNLLITEFSKDSSRFDILQDIGKVSYYMRDYKSSYQYYKQFLAMRESKHLDVYLYENMIIGFVYAKEGLKEKSEELIKSYKDLIDHNKSIYHDLMLASYCAYRGDQKKALENMKLFSKEDDIQYWVILFLENDPILESLKDNPEFKEYFNAAKSRFWNEHDRLKITLEEKGLL